MHAQRGKVENFQLTLSDQETEVTVSPSVERSHSLVTYSTTNLGLTHHSKQLIALCMSNNRQPNEDKMLLNSSHTHLYQLVPIIQNLSSLC